MRYRGDTFIALMIVVGGFLFQMGLQSFYRPFAINNFYFQKWSSEDLMQTVSILDLRDQPLESLFNIHIQPPGLDLIRTVLVHLWPAPDPYVSLLHVDSLMYILWSILYGLIGLLVYLWASKTTGKKVAVLSAVFFLLHPACIFYAMLLDTTILTSFLVLLLYYLLWKIRHQHRVTITALTTVLLALFFTRSIFELPFIIVIGGSLMLLEMPKQKVLLVVVIAGSVISLYLAKQYVQFGIFTTSSFTGFNLNRSIGKKNTDLFLHYLETNNDPSINEDELPGVLTRRIKLFGSPNHNNIQYLALNRELQMQYKEYMLGKPISRILRPYRKNLAIYFEPSSRYTEHVIVDRIAWRGLYDKVFSYPILVLLLLFFGVSWLIKSLKAKNLAKDMGLILPGFYIFLVTVLFERGENNRFKFFIEPVLFIFLVSQVYDAGWNFYRVLQTRLLRGSKSYSGQELG